MASKKTASAQRKTAVAKKAAAPKQRTATSPRSSRKTEKLAEDVVTIDRRRAAAREERQEEATPAPLLERRAKVQRRRQIDPTTCERDYSLEEVEFMNAMDDYKRKNGRMFPTCSEVLEVIRALGYVQISAAGRAMLTSDDELNNTAVAESNSAATTL
jgi:hypothetical protein